MRNLLLLFFLILFSNISAQENTYLKHYNSFLELQYSNRYIEKSEILNDILKYDFSTLWILPGKTDIDDISSFTENRHELMGFIGDDYQRIYIHFIRITKNVDNPSQYDVYGKSNVKGNICEFTGKIEIKLAKEFTFEYHEGEDFLVNINSVQKQGVVVCEFNLLENIKQKHSGKFKGILITSFFIDSKGKLKYNAIKGFSDSYRNNQFIGKWISYKTNRSKICNFGEWRIPNSGDLDIGAGEFSPSAEYFNKGWDPDNEIKSEWWK